MGGMGGMQINPQMLANVPSQTLFSRLALSTRLKTLLSPPAFR
jgi:hypothetical protein